MSTIFKWDKKDMDALLATCETDGIFPYIEKYMPAPSRVLESGCGAGRYVKYLHDRGWDVVGLEWDKEAVDMIRNYWPECTAVQGDSANSPFEENSFDGVISLGVIEHWIDGPQAPLKDIYRILKPGGLAIITAPCLNTIRKIKKVTWWNEIVSENNATMRWLRKDGEVPNRKNKEYLYWPYPTYGDFFEYRFTKKEFIDEISKAGFRVIEHSPIAVVDGLYHELNPGKKLIKYEDRQFKLSPAAKILQKSLSLAPFTYTHHQLAIVVKEELPRKSRETKSQSPVRRKSANVAHKGSAQEKTRTRKNNAHNIEKSS
jgi:SAM-dependent methyltransferase